MNFLWQAICVLMNFCPKCFGWMSNYYFCQRGCEDSIEHTFPEEKNLLRDSSVVEQFPVKEKVEGSKPSLADFEEYT